MDESAQVQCGGDELSSEDQDLLNSYHQSFDDERVDLDLIMDLLHNICSTSSDGEGHNHLHCNGVVTLLTSIAHCGPC